MQHEKTQRGIIYRIFQRRSQEYTVFPWYVIIFKFKKRGEREEQDSVESKVKLKYFILYMRAKSPFKNTMNEKC